MVNAILSQGGKIDACNQDGWTALMFAASANQYEALELLLEKGADVNIRAKNGNTALLVAFVFDYNKTAELLLEKSANPNFFYDNYEGKTLLMITIEHNSIEHIRLLLQHGTDVNSVNQKTGDTALMKAILNANKEIITLLLDNNADIEAGKSAWDALSCHSETCTHDYKGMRELLLKYAHQTHKKTEK